MSRLTLEVVVAIDDDLGIGRDGGLPWRLPGDLAHFRKLTSTSATPGRQNAVVMGRRTWLSIPLERRPLPARLNLVLSSSTLTLPEGVLHATSLEDAERLLALRQDLDRTFVIGGASLYAAALRAPACRRLHVTRVEGVFGCDTFFPTFADRFVRVAASERQEHHGIGFVFEVYAPRTMPPATGA